MFSRENASTKRKRWTNGSFLLSDLERILGRAESINRDVVSVLSVGPGEGLVLSSEDEDDGAVHTAIDARNEKSARLENLREEL